MNSLLERRYLDLLWAYNCGSTGAIQAVKHRLMLAMVDYQIRPDAALCLLTLYDQMILRPYYGSIPNRDGFPASGDLENAHPAPAFDVVQRSLDVILDRARHGGFEAPISSHSVLTIIQDVWPELSDLFHWG